MTVSMMAYSQHCLHPYDGGSFYGRAKSVCKIGVLVKKVDIPLLAFLQCSMATPFMDGLCAGNLD